MLQNMIGRMTADGTVIGEYPIPTPRCGARCIMATPDDRLFFSALTPANRRSVVAWKHDNPSRMESPLKIETIRYSDLGTEFAGVLIHEDAAKSRLPLLLMAPNWLGVSPDAIDRGTFLAGRGYAVFIADVYGEKLRPQGPEEAGAAANPLRSDPLTMRRRINAAMTSFIHAAETRGIGDASRRAAIGFCFGGGNVLELARSGAALQAVVSVHGDLTSLKPATGGDIKAAVLALHGAADLVSPKAQRDAFELEMEAAGLLAPLYLWRRRPRLHRRRRRYPRDRQI